jgi:hypothetical protein
VTRRFSWVTARIWFSTCSGHWRCARRVTADSCPAPRTPAGPGTKDAGARIRGP